MAYKSIFLKSLKKTINTKKFCKTYTFASSDDGKNSVKILMHSNTIFCKTNHKAK